MNVAAAVMRAIAAMRAEGRGIFANGPDVVCDCGRKRSEHPILEGRRCLMFWPASWQGRGATNMIDTGTPPPGGQTKGRE